MKFGGTSLAEPEKIKVAADKIISAKKKGFKVIAVVSAPSGITDDLIRLSRSMSLKPQKRELDALISTGERISSSLMAMAISAKGHKAVSLDASQAGIKTDDTHVSADIIAVNTKRISLELKKGKIVVIAGFQGIDSKSDVTTLGRGGSDFTAVAVAKAIKADICELYTDVKGIYATNPATDPKAKKIKKINYDDLIKLSKKGTEVRQIKAVRYAGKHLVPLHIRSSFHSETGTFITA